MVNILCISKEKSTRLYVDWLLKFSRKIPKLPRVGEFSMQIKNVQKWGVPRPKLDVSV